MNNKRLKWYFIIAFIPAWVLQAIGSVCKNRMVGGEMGSQGIYTASLTVCMFIPLLAAVISAKIAGEEVRVKLKPNLKGHIRWYAAAFLLPAVLGSIGAVLYFLVCSGNFDPEFTMIQQTTDAMISSGQNTAGLTPAVVLLALCVFSVTAAPLINGIPAFGEEFGWRGYMTPALIEKLGHTKGLIVSGVIWGVWHWPVIALAGYDFGTGYPLYPIPGLIAMCFACTALGILLSFLYEKSDSILVPAICHGAANAFLTLPPMFLRPGVTSMVLGPSLGIISMLPTAIVSFIILRGHASRRIK